MTSFLYSPTVHPEEHFKWYVPPEPVDQLGILALAMLAMTYALPPPPRAREHAPRACSHT